MLSDLPPLQDNEEDVSYDVESLFTNIPIAETIDYIISQIYDQKKLKSICSKLIFRRLLVKLATECTFKFNVKFYKQVDGCTMGGPLSVTFSDIYMIKMENDIVTPMKPIFYRRFVDEFTTEERKGENDMLFDRLNSYHPKIKLTLELNPSKFLDTKLICQNGFYVTRVNRKKTKLPIPWSSKIPKRYKRNTILGDLHRSKRISTSFEDEIQCIKQKFVKADYPLRFVNSVIREFNEPNETTNESFIIPPNLFEIDKPFVLVELPYCELNEHKSKDFLRKFHDFTKNCFKVAITWKTKKSKIAVSCKR